MASEKEIDIETRLGTRRIEVDKIITFPRGLAGFEDEHEFILLQLRPDAPLLILQSIRRPEVGLLVADPFSFLDSYPVMVGEAEQRMLKIGKNQEPAILVTVTIPSGHPENAMLNLTGPIVINHQERVGLQIPQAFEGPTQIPLRRPETAEQESN